MVGWLRWSEEKGRRPRVREIAVLGFPLLEVSLPRGDPVRRLKQGARALRRNGVRRVLPPPGWETGALPDRRDLRPVDPLPLCRAKAHDLTLTLLEGVPLRERRVALRGTWAGEAWPLADALCPQVGTLLLDFDRGGEELAGRLRVRYGVPPLPLGQGQAPQVSVELSPRETGAGEPLKLWGEPDLRGLTLSLDRELPPDLPRLPFLTLLWESGRVKTDEILVRKS